MIKLLADMVYLAAATVFGVIIGVMLVLLGIAAVCFGLALWEMRMVVLDKVFYWMLDMILGKHMCQKGKKDEGSTSS